MLGYLKDQKQNQDANNIILARALGRPLDTVEQFASRLIDHFDSDWQASQTSEEELIAEIDSCPNLPDDLKLSWLRLFQRPASEVQNTLNEWRWVKFMRYVGQNVPYNEVGLAVLGVTMDQFEAYDKVRNKFMRLSDMLIAGTCTGRLLMTDDVINYTVLRERAAAEAKSSRELFYYGVSIPQAAQDLLDDIVRSDKGVFAEMMISGAARCMFPNIQCNDANPGGVWLITMNCTTSHENMFGFFISKDPTRPRRVWTPKLTSNPVDTFIEEGLQLRRDAKAEFVERRDPARASIPAIPERRAKTPMALSNRPTSSIPDKPRQKVIKTAPKPRSKKFEVLRKS